MTAPTTAPAPAPDATSEAHGSGHFGYKPALDGLRAVAVMSVVAYHFGAGWLTGGFLGVDTFFVLSGYLITSLLLLEWRRSDTINFGGFWARRARRLLPALFLVLLVIALWGRIVLHPDQWGALRADSLWTLFYGANWHFIWSGQSYFTPEPSMLRHGWSLAIEEQFYLVWPLVVYACLRCSKGRHVALAAACVVGSVASIALMWSRFHPGLDPSRVYYGTDSRASQLFIGALLAIVLVHWGPKATWSRLIIQVLGVLGAVAMAMAYWRLTDRSPFLYRGGFTLFAIVVVLVITAIIQESRNPLRALLCLRPIRWIGAVSYGVYLWHWPIAVALSPARLASWGWAIDGWELAVVRLTATFVIAALSFSLVEKPIREHRFRRSLTPKLLVPVGFATVVLVIVASTAGATHNRLAVAPGTLLQTGNGSATSVTTRPGGNLVPSARMLLLGDSVADTLGNALATAGATDGVTVVTRARPGCGLTEGVATLPDGTPISWAPGCAAGADAYERQALDSVEPDTLLWHSTWENSDVVVGGKHLVVGTPAWKEWFAGELERVRALAADHGARLVFLTIPPRAPNPTIVVDPADTARDEFVNVALAKFAAQHPTDVGVVDFAAIVCPNGVPCPAQFDGITLRPRDGGHFEAAGATWVAPRLLDRIFTALVQMRPGPVTTTLAR
ncbi:MAG: acyltransferase family protein [Actinomycetes bacterium]